MELTSRIYECRVMHHRTSPKEHRFVHRIFMFCIDLDELNPLCKHLSFLGHNRFNLYSFYDIDHLQKNDRSTKDKVLDYIRENGVKAEDHFKVQLVTLPRIMGYVFNPVSFYFVYNNERQPVCAIAEVGNTYHEMKPYLLTVQQGERFRLRVPKHFYVSPFSRLDLDFDFSLAIPGDQLNVHINEYEGKNRILTSSVTGDTQSFTNGKLIWYTIKYPLLTLRVVALIHWNALLLYLKGIKHHPKADNPKLQRKLCRTSKTNNQSV